jgi:DNA-binding response OmpR family regulator/TolB-like protein/Tfp pilus assembly protein PilF
MLNQPTPAPADDVSPILLVDDDPTNLDLLREILAGPGYRLYVARTGEDALKIARRAQPLLILLDVVMPGIDGYETCRRLKGDPETRDAAVIFLSALDDVKDKVRGFEAGAVDFITKPVVGDEVLARVKTHLAIQRLLRRQAEERSQAEPPETPGETQGAGDSETVGSSLEAEGKRSTSVFRTGDIVAFRFRIVRYIAKGGMGELYEAEDLELRTRVALKTILSHIADDERSILMFKREVHLARQVTHPNVCRIYDVFRHRSASARGIRPAPDVVFLSMELLHGETLADTLQRDGPFKTADILPVVRQMAAGLTAAHLVGVVHRDFKSHNVMLVKPVRAGDPMRVVVTDFGLAWRSAQNESTGFSLSMSSEGEISGTPAYMAPEQVEGGAVTPATDVYALGVVLYEMVTGVWPFLGETPLKIAVKRLTEPPPSPRVHVADVDPLWEATILRCLARLPEHRFATTGDVVAALERGLVDEAETLRPRPWWRTRGARWALAFVILAALVAGYATYARTPAVPGRAAITSLAILPFASATSDPGQEYLSDGISEGLINRLSQLEGVKVIANSSASRYKGKDADPQEVARALNVAAILVGRVSQRADNLSISVELIDGRDRTQVWGKQYARKAADLRSVEAEISRDITEKLQGRLTSGQQQRLESREMRNPVAYELLLMGHSQRARGGTEDRRKAAEYFTQAIAADPGYALAYADLSDIYRSLVNSGLLDPNEYLPKARAAAQKALELDDSLADAHYALANLMTYGWEWADAEREYTRAIALNPNLALAHRWYAAYLRILGRHEQAIVEITRARELDPLSPGVNATAGWVLMSAGQYDKAIETLKKTLELDQNYPYAHLFLGHTYAAQGQYMSAAAAYQQAMALGLDTPATQIFLGATYARSGHRDRALAILTQVRSSKAHVSAADLAILLAALGDRERAFASLEDAYGAHDTELQYLGVEPGFDRLRGDRRFESLLQRVGLRR